MKLGTAGDLAKGGTRGEGPVRQRKPRRAEQVAERVERFRRDEGLQPARAEFQQGVQPLNPGVEELERLRALTVGKARARREKKVRGDR